MARTVLTSLAGALLTITTFTFSTILAVLTLFASNYTPRAIENFIDEKITMQILGIYIGGFFYCISALMFMRESSDERLVIAGTIAIIYSIVCIIYFVIFVQKVLHSMQGVNLIANIYDETVPVIEKEIYDRANTKEYSYEKGRYDMDIYADDFGYLTVIDTDALEYYLEDKDGILKINSRIGDYLVKDMPIALLSLDQEFEDEEEEDKFRQKIEKCFLMQDRKAQDSDYRFGITKLVDITLRAISPGINDPNTAIHAIIKLSILVGKLASVDFYHILKAQGKNCEIYYTSYKLKEDLYNTFHQILHYAKEDVSVMHSILRGLYTIHTMATDKNKVVVKEFADYVYDIINENFSSALDMEYLNEAYNEIK